MTNLDKLESFLISNSDISKEFINDFFGFQKKQLYEEYKPFTIDLEDVAYWLETRKTRLKETLITNYSKNIDYLLVKNLLPANRHQNTHGGHNKKLVLLTPDCFKMLCMRSKTKKADKVREYYIEIEKLIDKYKDIIIEENNKKIKILENDLRKEKQPSGNICYIFEEIDELNIKYYRLGQSGDLTKRMATHNSSSVHKKVVAFKIKTDNILHYEACLRGSMYNFRYKNNKDYYKIPLEKIKYAIKNCGGVVKKLKNNIDGGENNNYVIDNKKINTEIKIMFSKISKCVMWNVYEKPSLAYYNGKKITNKKLNKVILEQSRANKILIVPCQRDSEYYETIDLGFDEISYKTLFDILYKFYKEPIDINYLEKIPNDISEYVSDAIKKIKHEQVNRNDLIGNLCRFEGVRNVYGNIYWLIMGS
uniref:MSV199 domain-containing protein n=1 Tax=viral metagenome TaxID=1070528 RepID=A0A6C0DY54_9ZZZZ